MGEPAPTQVESLLTDAVEAAGGDAVAWVALPDRGALTLAHVRGQLTDTLQGLRVPAGWGLTGKVALLRRPASVTDYFNDTGIAHAFDFQVAAERVRQMVAVPLEVAGRRGVLTVGLRSGAVTDRATDRLVRLTSRDLGGLVAPGDEVAAALGEIGGRLERLRHGIADVEVRTLLTSAAMLVDRSRTAVRGRTPSGEPSPEPATTPALTRRELQILRRVAAGGTNAAIAHDLGLSANTVKTYWQATLRKLEVGNRAEAIHAAHRLGLLGSDADDHSGHADL
ncbi:hypothetical protein GCM10022215_24510 [Nocardioides fonticola]|uniref:HTH luxR-type domain-containing protein n=1 Tax=Nocardioides fonticola TaxID=450363 RepID=A0ABP7XK05_9ACTN